MKTKEIILYGIILGLVVNLIANQIFKFLPDAKHVDFIFTIVLIIICVLLIVFNNSKYEKIVIKESSFKVEEELITGSIWSILAPDGQTFKVKVIKNNLIEISFQLPLGTLDIAVERIKIVSMKEKLIKMF